MSLRTLGPEQRIKRLLHQKRDKEPNHLCPLLQIEHEQPTSSHKAENDEGESTGQATKRTSKKRRPHTELEKTRHSSPPELLQPRRSKERKNRYGGDHNLQNPKPRSTLEKISKSLYEKRI
ncbi:hypothetical protein DY000_02041805 [Brassica cretica]|uniref:Shugoshin C-terminal domain-containing protein n=1 Tax=Brassica cretica TaxID=69181 RepID=A0ABQ7BKR8_BRACR|nr:hypothetical protein DY000_02041805 [Brassica cretica]